MFSRLRSHFGMAGLVVAIVALIAALGGGAIAATGGSGDKATASATGKQGKQGKQGKRGKPGPAGPKGENGAAGSQGPQGPAGSSVEVGTEATGTGNCGGQGGATVQVAGQPATKKVACNGAEGSPWTAGGTLPSGETETGAFAMSGNYPGGAKVAASLSFPIPLGQGDEELISEFSFNGSFELVFPHLHVLVPGENPTTECPGTLNQPKALPGHLCLYISESINGFAPQAGYAGAPFFGLGKPSGVPGVGTSGATLLGTKTAGDGLVSASGSWAVTAQ